MSVVQLQELLLVQLVKVYGTHDYGKIAAILQQHPLLRIHDGCKTDWTESECQKLFDATLVSEGLKAENSLAATPDIVSLLGKLHAQYIAHLKHLIRHDEAEYRRLKEESKSEDSHEISPDRTDQDLDPARTKSSDDESPMLLAASDQGNELMTKDSADGISNGELPKLTPNKKDTSDLEQDAEIQMKHKIAAQDTNSTTLHNADGISLAGAEDVAQADGAQTSETKDEIVTDFDVDAGGHSTDTAETPDVPATVAAPRVTRKRSNTSNTVGSMDTTTNDDQEADHSLKRRGGRISRRSTIREDGAKSPDLVQSDDQEAFAALKRFQSTMAPLISNISSHRYASVFTNPVSNKEAPNYSTVVKSPMDLKTVRSQIKSGEINNVQVFHKAILLMLSNAIMYNHENSEIAMMARDLLQHVEEAIVLFHAAEETTEVGEDRTPKRRRRNEQ